MSTVFRGTPSTFTPVYNPVYFYPDSTHKNEEGFKYIVDLYSAGTQTKIARYKLFPRPDDGFGVADINQVLGTQIGTFFSQDLNGFSRCPLNYYNYDIRIGEEYVSSWTYDYIADNGPYTNLINTGNTDSFYLAGDQIYITTPSGSTNSFLNGNVYTVVSAITGFLGLSIVVLDVDGSTTDFADSGSTIYSDHRKTEFTGVTASTGTVFNGVISHKDFKTYDPNDFNIITGSTTARFLTNLPSGYRVKTSNKMWLNLYSTNTGAYANRMNIITTYGSYVYTNPYSGTSDTMLTLACGPDNITNFTPSAITNSGTLPVFKNNTYSILSSANVGGQLGVYLDSVPVYTGDDVVSFESNVIGLNGNYLIAGILGNLITLDTAYVAGVTSGRLYQKTDYYTIQMLDATQTPTSEALRIGINDSCFRYENIELYFIDRLGSYVPVNFELQSARKIDINRQEYQTLLGDLSGNKWTYSSTDGGRKSLNVEVKQELEVQSNWLTEDEVFFLQELYSSPVVYIKEQGELYPVMITSNTYDIKTKNNKKNIQIKLTLEYSNNDRVQNF